MLAPPRIGLSAQRVNPMRNLLRVAPSTRRATYLSSRSSPSIHPNPPTGVMTRFTCPTPVKQWPGWVQGQEPSSFHGERTSVPYFSTVSSLSGPMLHCVLDAAFHMVALNRLHQYSRVLENSSFSPWGSF